MFFKCNLATMCLFHCLKASSAWNFNVLRRLRNCVRRGKVDNPWCINHHDNVQGVRVNCVPRSVVNVLLYLLAFSHLAKMQNHPQKSYTTNWLTSTVAIITKSTLFVEVMFVVGFSSLFVRLFVCLTDSRLLYQGGHSKNQRSWAHHSYFFTPQSIHYFLTWVSFEGQLN